MPDRIYLGDGVYVHMAHYGLVLTVEDGLQLGGEIALSEKAYTALAAYVARQQEYPQEEEGRP